MTSVAQVTVASVGVASSTAAGVRPPVHAEQTWPPVPVELGTTPACRHDPSLTIVIPDGSGSVTAMNGNDPVGRRLDETRLAFAHMACTCRCKQELAAVVHFDPGRSDRGPVPLDSRGFKILDEALVVPLGGTSSLLGPALDVAERLADAHPNHHHVLVVMSDFLLFDTDVSATLGRVGSFHGTSFAVVLGTQPPDLLAADPRITVIRIAWDSRPGEVARALVEALAAPRTRRS